MATGSIKKVTNDSGSGYCKMPDGTLIQWGSIPVSSVPITNTWGSLYESDIQRPNVTYPVAFVDTPSVVAFADTTATSWLENLKNNSTGITSFYLVRATSASAGVSGSIKWHAIGRWK